MSKKRRYINVKTGAIVDSSSKIVGRDWKPYEDAKNDEHVEKEYVEENVDLETMTKDELIEFAKEQDIKVSARDTKADIIDTIVKAFEE